MQFIRVKVIHRWFP